jgi:hypothetical protein
MTKDEAVSALEAQGASDVWFMSRSFDAGAKMGVGLSFMAGGKLRRNAVRVPSTDEGKAMDEGLPLLVDWALEELAA